MLPNQEKKHIITVLLHYYNMQIYHLKYIFFTLYSHIDTQTYHVITSRFTYISEKYYISFYVSLVWNYNAVKIC